MDSSVHFHSDSIKKGYNHYNYQNIKVNSILDKLISSNEDNKLKLMDSLGDIFYYDPPGAFLNWRKAYFVSTNTLTNVEINPFNMFSEISKWNKD